MAPTVPTAGRDGTPTSAATEQEALIDPVDQNMVYGCSQYGVCARSTNGGDSTFDFTGATMSSRRNWLTPVQFDPANPAVLYYAGNQVNRSVDHAVHWAVISPDLTGGPGRDPNYPFGTVTTVAGAKTDPNRVLAGTDDGRLWFTTNLGGNWTQVTDPDVPGTWVTRVTVDPVNANVAYATFSGFRSGVALPYVLKTTDGGATWASIVGNLPQAPVNDIVVAGSVLYVGTDVGVFSSANGGAKMAHRRVERYRTSRSPTWSIGPRPTRFTPPPSAEGCSCCRLP